MAGGFAYKRYTNFRRRQERAVVAQMEEVAMGTRSVEAMLVEGSVSHLVLVPNDGSVLKETDRYVTSSDRSQLPTIEMKPGMIVFFGVKGRNGEEVSVCLKSLCFGEFRFYPGMTPYYGLTIGFLLIGIVFVNTVILVLALAYPPDGTMYAICGAFGGVAGTALGLNQETAVIRECNKLYAFVQLLNGIFYIYFGIIALRTPEKGNHKILFFFSLFQVPFSSCLPTVDTVATVLT